MLHRCDFAFVLLLAFGLAPAFAQLPRPRAWETCSLTEGKKDSCGPGDLPRVFEEYLRPGAWAKTRGDSFSGEFQFDINIPGSAWTVDWSDVGTLGSHRIRQIRHKNVERNFAKLLLAENAGGLYVPLMKWSGDMPEPSIHKLDGGEVLEIAKDFGGNIPMVETWAWVWTEAGPIRLDIAAAVLDATTKIAPGYSRYGTSMNWKRVHNRTWVWKGKYPGKVGVSDQVDAWFTLRGDRLIVKRVELRELFSEEPTRTWPK